MAWNINTMRTNIAEIVAGKRRVPEPINAALTMLTDYINGVAHAGTPDSIDAAKVKMPSTFPTKTSYAAVTGNTDIDDAIAQLQYNMGSTMDGSGDVHFDNKDVWIEHGGNLYVDGNNAGIKVGNTHTISDVTLVSTDNPLQIGPTSGTNMAFDQNEIQVRNNSAVASIFINANGGDIGIGDADSHTYNNGQFSCNEAAHFNDTLSAVSINTTDGLTIANNRVLTVRDNPAPIGSIVMWPSTSAPFRWVICNGQELSRTDYADLFAIIGTSFGTPSSGTVFKVPDLRGRFPLGVSTATAYDTVGETGGVTKHKHNLSSAGWARITLGSSIYADKKTVSSYTATDQNSGGTYSSSNATVSSASILDGTTDDCTDPTLPPYMALNFIIKVHEGL